MSASPPLVAQRIAALIVLRPDQTEATIRAQCSRLASEWKNRTFGDVLDIALQRATQCEALPWDGAR